MIEEWRAFNDELEVSSKGNVRFSDSKEPVNQYKCGAYLRVHTTTVHEYVHRIVASVFIPNPHNYQQINHLDCNGSNNDMHNLEWCTHRQNQHYKFIGPNAAKNYAIQKELSGRSSGMTGKRHSDATKLTMSIDRKSRIWVHKGNKTKFVHATDIDALLADGYVIGRGKI